MADALNPLRTFYKDPDSVLDYGFDWTAWLAGDTISTSTWVLTAGITKDSDSTSTVISTIWVSGGTVDTEYILANTIVTAAGRTAVRSLCIAVRDR